MSGTLRDDVSRSKPCSQAGMLARKTSRSEASRGGLIESHTVVSVARMPVVPLSDAGISRTAAAGGRSESAATFFRPDDDGLRSEISFRGEDL
jgi:hypothetical protein